MLADSQRWDSSWLSDSGSMSLCGLFSDFDRVFYRQHQRTHALGDSIRKLKCIYQPGYAYQKAGAMLLRSAIARPAIGRPSQLRRRTTALVRALGAINARMDARVLTLRPKSAGKSLCIEVLGHGAPGSVFSGPHHALRAVAVTEPELP